jgi:2-oxoisovalerate dehydrogenase E1 component alpha subunit
MPRLSSSGRMPLGGLAAARRAALPPAATRACAPRRPPGLDLSHTAAARRRPGGGSRSSLGGSTVRTGRGQLARTQRRHSSSFGEGAGTTFQREPANREFVSTLEFLDYDDVPLFQVMDEDGDIMDPVEEDKVMNGVGHEEAVKMHETMVRVAVMDHILYEAQRQGRISFYMTSTGEEATHVGAASALEDRDVIFAQYREQGVLMYRGFSFEQFCNQCCSNALDPAKGRQMPVHYGSTELNHHTISSPLATQLPHAVGAAYALKLEQQDAVAMCFFGDGAASEGDFHAALNFAATLKSPVIFFCRNNGYAISTSIEEQMASDGIVARGPAYGVPATRVDGNDIWAVRSAVAKARKMALEENTPVMIEAITYRMGHHSTSDDSLRYRQQGEMEFWKEQDNPMLRMRNFLKKRGWYTDEQEEELRKQCRKEVLAALNSAEKAPKLGVHEMFEDVYDVMPAHLREQKAEVEAHIARNPDAYKNLH